MLWKPVLIISCLLLSINSQDDFSFQQFIKNVEALIVNTIDRALIVTRNVYLNLNRTMSTRLRNATQQVMLNYIQQVDDTLRLHLKYIDKRKLLQQFRANNHYIEQLRKQLDPQQPAFRFQLISDQFYNEGRNTTELDNLYLEFMNRFQEESQQLWQHLSENTVEQQEELLEILDEISNEKQLQEKDKLYDEFIEMFLFKDKGENVQNRELD